MRDAVDHGVDPAKAAQAADIDADRTLAGIDLGIGARHTAQNAVHRLQILVFIARAERARPRQRVFFAAFAAVGGRDVERAERHAAFIIFRLFLRGRSRPVQRQSRADQARYHFDFHISPEIANKV
ncbi:hypothetical protein LZL50_21780 [Pseudomonas aeruginosa]|nr:hypothetical protein [Pseudomonas aeruginosa]